MKKTVKIARIAVMFIFIIGVSHLVHRSLNYLLTPNAFVITDDKILMQNAFNEIDTYVRNKTDYKNKSLKDIALCLKKEFPYINHIAVTLIPTKLIIDIQIHKPRFVINNDFVLMDSGMLNPIKLFSKEVVSTLPMLTLNQSTCICELLIKRCFRFLDSMSPAMFHEYDCFWENEQVVWLTNKQDPRFVILADMNSLNDQKKLLMCTTLKNDIESRKKCSLSRSTEWITDIRFDNQVIIFSRGGKGHGYTTLT